VSELHDRTPVTLPPSFWDEWLDADQDGDQTLVDAAVTAATPVAEALELYQVAPLKGDGPELVEPALHKQRNSIRR
jgi:putative SOS response-associated peptidase YedK